MWNICLCTYILKNVCLHNIYIYNRRVFRREQRKNVILIFWNYTLKNVYDTRKVYTDYHTTAW